MKIWKFKPFTTDKTKFGQEYNSHCELVPNNDDWILILDYDCMILSPMAYQVIETAIKRYPNTLIFGAYANRVGLTGQRLSGPIIDENDSIKHWQKMANERAEFYKDGECKEGAKLCAGFFLLFRKSYWLKNKFQDTIIQPRTGFFFDYLFSRPAGKQNGIRLIKGVLCWHSYRIDKNVKDKSHLKI